MKTTWIFLLWLAPWCAAGQVGDSLVVAREVDSLLKTATELWRAGQLQEALPLTQQAANVSKQTWGENHAKYAASLHRRASIYKDLGQNDLAETLYLKAIDLRSKVLGKEHPDYVTSLNNLGNLYGDKGDYSKAESFFLEAKEIQAKVLGREHPDYATSLEYLAIVYDQKDDLAKVEPLYLEVLEIRAKALGKEHPHYAYTLNNLSIYYSNTGNYAKAEACLLESKEICAKTLGKENPDYATSLILLGVLYKDKGDNAKAESFLSESKEILAKIVGDEHPLYVHALHNLADLYTLKGDYIKAESLSLQVLEIKAKTLGKENLYYPSSLVNLAILYQNKGDYLKAEPLFSEAKEIVVKALGKGHRHYAKCLFYQAIFYQKAGRIAESAILFLELNTLNGSLIEKTATYSSENQMLAYLRNFEEPITQFQSFLQAHPNPELSRASFDNALLLNGYLLENARRLTRSVAGADSLTRETYHHWQVSRRRLANEYAKPIAERQHVAELEAEAEGYEKTLARNLATFSETRKIPHWQDVRDRLRTGEAAIEFIRYHYYKPEATDSTMYAALVLRPGDAYPQLVPLFENRQILPLLRKTNSRDRDLLDQAYTFQPGKGSLYSLVWQPLDSLLQGVHTIYCAPTGVLHRLNLGAIPVSPDQTFADRHRLVTLGSTRQLVSRATTTPTATLDAILFGGVQYDLDSIAIVAIPPGGSRGMEEATLPFPFDTLRAGGQKPWPNLPNTQTEVTNIGGLLRSKGYLIQVRSGADASEETFKQIGQTAPSPRILHLATHGYFFPDPENKAPKGSGDLGTEPVFKSSEQPMIRSGLILAGANRVWLGGKPWPGREDGILTAYEISQMNLENTELVVLSACETGLGAIEGNEGVYGLQRAFKIAGARYLIMSLWSVSDRKTAELMQAFFQNYLEKGQPVPEAFRAAQQAMRLKYPKTPSAWAGFVLLE